MEKLTYYLITLFYKLGLRRILIKAQRVLSGEWKTIKTPLPDIYRPEDVETYINQKFKYRLDTLSIGNKKIPLDWVTTPEVFQTRLENPEDVDGDCDDYHYWAATMLARIPGVSNVMMVSTVWSGGGHTVCTYFYNRKWFLFNYGISEIDSPNDVPRLVFKRHAEVGSKVLFYVFEDLDFNLLAAKPDSVKEVVYGGKEIV